MENRHLKLHLMLEEEMITALEDMFRELERRNAVYALYQSICIQVLLELYSMASQFHKCELEKKDSAEAGGNKPERFMQPFV